MNKDPGFEEPVISMTKDEFGVLSNYTVTSRDLTIEQMRGMDEAELFSLKGIKKDELEDVEAKREQALRIAEKYNIRPTEEPGSSIKIEVDGKVLDVTTWENDFGTVKL